jgi:hypothetical protein
VPLDGAGKADRLAHQPLDACAAPRFHAQWEVWATPLVEGRGGSALSHSP